MRNIEKGCFGKCPYTGEKIVFFCKTCSKEKTCNKENMTLIIKNKKKDKNG